MARIMAASDRIRQYRDLISEGKNSVAELSGRLSEKLSQAGRTWDDQSYRRLAEIVDACIMELKQVQKELLRAEVYLSSLLRLLEEYERVRFPAPSSQLDRAGASPAAGTQSDKGGGKYSNLRDGLQKAEQVINQYKTQLIAQGITNPAVLDAVLSYYRLILEGNLLRLLNGEKKEPYPAPDLNAIAQNSQNINIPPQTGGSSAPRSLNKTRYGFREITWNGEKMQVYDDPVGTNGTLIGKQGKSHYPMKGTCGLCQCANLLTLAGVPTTEDEIIHTALGATDTVLDHMELFHPSQNRRGGTSTADRRELLERMGLPMSTLPMSANSEASVQQLADYVSSGHGVIVSVDVVYLWRNGQSGGHAISLLSVSEDGSTFFYNDTGAGRLGTVSASDLSQALTGRPANITTNVIR